MLSDSFSQDNLFAKTKVSKKIFSQTGYKSSASPTIFYKLVSLIGFFFFFKLLLLFFKCQAKNQGKNIINTYDV